MDRSPQYRKHVEAQSCAARGSGTACCGKVRSHHHDKQGSGGGLALKGSDYFTAPLCDGHHGEYHKRARVGELSEDATEILIVWSIAECQRLWILARLSAPGTRFVELDA